MDNFGKCVYQWALERSLGFIVLLGFQCLVHNQSKPERILMMTVSDMFP